MAVQTRLSSASTFHTRSGVPMVGMMAVNLAEVIGLIAALGRQSRVGDGGERSGQVRAGGE